MSSLVPKEINVVLLAGGKSGEREISLASGAGAKKALEDAGFNVVQLDPAEKDDLVKLVQGQFDVAFLALHGKGGEDGAMQGMLEVLGIPYTGPGIWSSATAMDKAKAKVFYRSHGVPTPESLTLHSVDELSPNEIADKVGSRCVVKAATEGSALGVYLCDGVDDIAAALTSVFEIDDVALAETFVSGDEYTVAVLGTEAPEALPVIQIVPMHEFYDFESKYAEGGSKHICPAPLSAEETKKACDLAVAAHRALGCEGVSRTDMIKDSKGDFWVLETNTIPGMTATSLLPDAARVAGMDFPALCCRLIEEALSRKA